MISYPATEPSPFKYSDFKIFILEILVSNSSIRIISFWGAYITYKAVKLKIGALKFFPRALLYVFEIPI